MFATVLLDLARLAHRLLCHGSAATYTETVGAQKPVRVFLPLRRVLANSVSVAMFPLCHRAASHLSVFMRHGGIVPRC